tara:strand:+ start:6216 stop:7367 length:1152 start_codon:yes stop_codon:yes gene_type:complete
MEGFFKLLAEVWEEGLLGIGLTEILISISIVAVAFILRAFVVSRVFQWVESLADKTETEVDDVVFESLRKPVGFIPITLALYLVSIYLPLAGSLGTFIENLVKASLAFTIFSVFSNAVSPLFSILSKSTILTAAMTMWLERAIRVLVWVIGFAIILDIFGIQIGPIVAGLGLFSVAVALGAQDLFKNLISGILIIAENRFQPGDRIEVEGHLHGMVDKIGFRSTVIRLFNTSPMIIPNKDLSDVKVINHGEMYHRRIDWKINLVYSTTLDQLKEICTKIETFLSDYKDLVVNEKQESFAKTVAFNSSSIDVQILCFTNPCNFTEFSTIKEDLVYEIINIVRSSGSEFAFPSRSIYVESGGSDGIMDENDLPATAIIKEESKEK